MLCNMSNVPKRVTIALCGLNLVVAVYLTSIVFRPLYSGVGNYKGILGGASQGKTTNSAELIKQLKALSSLEVASTGQQEELQKKVADKLVIETRKARESETGTMGEVADDCHVSAHTDYDGFAVTWGISHFKDSAAECCQACKDHATSAGEGERRCNIWVYCPIATGCFSPDIYDHLHKECWLKQAEEAQVIFTGAYAKEFREEHRTAPPKVQWVGGVL